MTPRSGNIVTLRSYIENISRIRRVRCDNLGLGLYFKTSLLLFHERIVRASLNLGYRFIEINCCQFHLLLFDQQEAYSEERKKFEIIFLLS